MSIGALTSVTSTTEKDPTTGAPKSALDKEAFLKLLVAQLSHQDPLKPMEGTEFVAQLAQFASVEQSMQQTQALGDLGTAVAGVSRQQATALIGRTVTAKGGKASFDGTAPVSLSATLGGAAKDVKVSILDASGKPVRTIDLGPRGAGNVAMNWDGRDDAGNLLPAGSYSVQVHAVDEAGKPVSADQQISGTVTKISFAKGYAEVQLTDGTTVPLSQLVEVGAPATK